MAKSSNFVVLVAAGVLGAAGLLVLVMLVVQERPAEATFPGKPGKIAYSGEDGPNGDYEVYTIKPDGGGKFKVTDNSTGDYTPSWGSS